MYEKPGQNLTQQNSQKKLHQIFQGYSSKNSNQGVLKSANQGPIPIGFSSPSPGNM